MNRLLIGNSKYLPWRNLVLHWTLWEFFTFSSSLKPLNRFQHNFVTLQEWLVDGLVLNLFADQKFKMAARLKIEKKVNFLKFSPETTKPILVKLYWSYPWVVTFQNCVRTPTSDQYGHQAKNVIFSSETVVQILTKLCWNNPHVILYQNCVWHFWPQTKMAATAVLSLT